MLLTEGISKKYVLPTEYTRKLTIDGHTESYQVYKIRLDQLYYNDKNDRIATWISKYKEENDLSEINVRDENYNNVVQEFITESNPKAIDKTKRNIGLVGQREAGVILSDGRIIDGNRRFTCLRMLNSEGDNINHFEAVILERNIDENQKEIKLLELAIQHGEESKVDYNPIDKLVGLYNDVVENELITIEEYRKTTGETVGTINKKIEEAKLMVEFLEFIDAPKKFYIARDLELDGPLVEVTGILNKLKSEEEKEDIKLIIFSNLLLKPQGDITRYIRKMKKVVETEYVSDFIDEQLEFVEEVAASMESNGEITTDTINQDIRSNEDLKVRMKSSVERFEIKSKKDDTRTQPIKEMEKSILHANNIDSRIVGKMTTEERQHLKILLQECKEKISEIEKYL